MLSIGETEMEEEERQEAEEVESPGGSPEGHHTGNYSTFQSIPSETVNKNVQDSEVLKVVPDSKVLT